MAEDNDPRRPLLRRVTDDGIIYLFTVGPASIWSIERNGQIIEGGPADKHSLARGVRRFRKVSGLRDVRRFNREVCIAN